MPGVLTDDILPRDVAEVLGRRVSETLSPAESAMFPQRVRDAFWREPSMAAYLGVMRLSVAADQDKAGEEVEAEIGGKLLSSALRDENGKRVLTEMEASDLPLRQFTLLYAKAGLLLKLARAPEEDPVSKSAVGAEAADDGGKTVSASK